MHTKCLLFFNALAVAVLRFAEDQSRKSKHNNEFRIVFNFCGIFLTRSHLRTSTLASSGCEIVPIGLWLRLGCLLECVTISIQPESLLLASLFLSDLNTGDMTAHHVLVI